MVETGTGAELVTATPLLMGHDIWSIKVYLPKGDATYGQCIQHDANTNVGFGFAT